MSIDAECNLLIDQETGSPDASIWINSDVNINRLISHHDTVMSVECIGIKLESRKLRTSNCLIVANMYSAKIERKKF